jgi:hypothetical protein
MNMQTLQFQVQDDVYQDIIDRGIDIQSRFKEFLFELRDDGYPSISTEEAKQRVSDAVDRYRSGMMETISHDDMWNTIDMDCKVKSADRI